MTLEGLEDKPKTTRHEIITLEDVKIFGIKKEEKFGGKHHNIGIFLTGAQLKKASQLRWTLRTFVGRKGTWVKAAFRDDSLKLPSAEDIAYDVDVFGFEWEVNGKRGVKLYTTGFRPHTQGE